MPAAMTTSSRWIAASAARACLALAVLAACGHGPGAPSTLGDGWVEIGEQTACFIADPQTQCLGYLGFVAQRDGTFSAGGRVTGQLSASERSALQRDVAALDASFPTECDQAAHSDYQDRVWLTLADRSSVVAYNFADGCHRGGRAQAERVHADLRALMEKYYPLPFPP